MAKKLLFVVIVLAGILSTSSAASVSVSVPNSQEKPIDSKAKRGFFDNPLDSFKSGWDTVASTATDLAKDTQTLAEKGWTTVSDKAPEIFQDAKELATNGWNTVIGNKRETDAEVIVSRKRRGFLDSIKSGWETVSSKASEFADDTSNFASKSWDKVSDKAPGFFEDAQKFASNSWDTVSDKAPGIFEDAQNFASNSWNSVSEKAKEVFE